MNSIKQLVTILMLLCTNLSIFAQSPIEAGSDQTLYCNESVQLNAKALKGWGNLNSGTTVPFYAVYFTSVNVGYAVGLGGEIYYGDNGGSSWVRCGTPISNTNTLYSVYFINSTTGFVVGANGTIMKTTNWGYDWTVKTSGVTSQLRSVYFTSETVGYCVGSGGVILKTIDGGNTWTNQTVGSTNTYYSVYFTSANNGFVCGSAGTLLRTTDGGSTWTSATIESTLPILYSIHFPTPTTGFISGNLGTILKTTDGGASWSKYAKDSVFMETESNVVSSISFRKLSLAYLNSIHFVSETEGYAVGAYSSGGIIVKTIDGGTTWFEQRNNLAAKITGLCFPTSKTGFAVGNAGKIAKLYDGSATFTNYLWSPTDGLSDPNITNPVASPTVTTKYIVSAIENGYLLTKDSIYIKVMPFTTAFGLGTGREIACEGSVMLDSLKTNYSGTGKLKYKWDASPNLSCDTIPNPFASAPGHYTVTVTTPEGCTASSSIDVSMTSLKAIAKVDRTVVCSGAVQLSVSTNYTGKNTLHYKWSPSTGLNNDTIANPIATVNAQKTYSVTVTTNSGCSATGSVTVNVYPLVAEAGVNKSVVCGGSVQLSTVTTNYTGAGVFRYKWTPSTGLNNDTISNPIATLNSNTVYWVAVTSPSGCTASDNVSVTVLPLTANAGADKTILCGGTAQLDAVATNYTGTGILRYKWSPSTGLNNDTIANPTSKTISNTTYTVTVTSPSGCTATDNVIVTVTPLTVNAGVDKIVNCGVPVQLGVTSTNYIFAPPLKYKWTPATGLSNDTIANPIAAASNITYTVTITSPSGCTASDNVAISITPMTKPSLNYIGVNTKNKNILVWTKPTAGKITAFNVYKETNVTNSFVKVGSVLFDSVSVFVDTISKPDVQSNKYKLSIVDACNNESALSDYHKTMHLSISKGVNTIWNLIWETYEGYSVSTYNIYRGTTPDNIQIIGSLSGSNTQFSDYTAPSGYVYYQIEAISATPSAVSNQNKSGLKSVVGVAYSSRSNIASNKSGTDGLNNLKDISGSIAVYPNPARNNMQLVVNDDVTNTRLDVYNVLGSLVKTQEVVVNKQQIDLSNLTEGIYLLVVKSDKFIGKQKLVIQK
jgi:photosystem II stability/assembly factor-like uncharacterized protein